MRTPIRNPYALGHLTMLLGAMAVACVWLPRLISEHDQTTNEHQSLFPDTPVSGELTPARIASIALSVVGLSIGPFGWRREKPPVLSIVGMVFCGVALFWPYVVVAYSVVVWGLAILLMIFVMVFGVL